MSVGRFAPSPTGSLHLGNARSALLGFLLARSQGGQFLLRLEDLDPERSKPEAAQALREELAWLGLDFDGPALVQSQRAAHYAAALATLQQAGRAYPCWCSRAEVARAAAAPHAGEEGPRYPGTCAHGAAPKPGRTPSLRFRVAPGVVRFTDLLHGPQAQDVEREVGDFVVQRFDGVASYQLAVVVDDTASGVTTVLRGDDLLASTPRQLQLFEALGLRAPQYAHVPLLLGEDGRRLAKRDGALTLAALRAQGVQATALVGLLARTSGLSDGAPTTPQALVADFSLARVSKESAVVRSAELEALARGSRA